MMNICLLVKWIWKLTQNKKSQWAQLLCEKYRFQGDFFNAKTNGGSQFWRGLQKVKHWFKWGAIHKVGDGRSTRFRTDIWIGPTPFKTQFPILHSICIDPNALVCDLVEENDWNINFRRSCGVAELQIYRKGSY